MRLDAPTFARAYLSVAQASATKDDVPALSQTVAFEEFLYGMRLVATDRFVMLTAWVPSLDARFPAEPTLDEAPDRTVIVRDGDKRGKSLMSYVLTLAKREHDGETPDGTLEVEVGFDARLPSGAEAPETLEGLEPTYATLTVPDREKVFLPVVEAAYPQWRALVDSFTAEETKVVAFNPEFVSRLVGVRAWAHGPLVWTFGGSEKVAAVDFPESDPHVTGLVMPSRLHLPDEAPVEEDDGKVFVLRPVRDGDAEDDAGEDVDGDVDPEQLVCPVDGCGFDVHVSTEDPDASLSEMVGHGFSVHHIEATEYLRMLHNIDEEWDQ
jgi:hypothetical protein